MTESRRLLAERTATFRTGRSRACCWLARSALEEAVSALLRARALDLGEASMRTRLACLSAHAVLTRDSALAARARQASIAWTGLSRACHHHAFELSPTVTEAEHLLDLVAAVIGVPASSDPDRPPSQP